MGVRKSPNTRKHTCKMAFKVSSLLVENFVRRRYYTLSLTWRVLILDWHFETFRDAEQILINRFNIPETRAADPLQRLDPQFMGWKVKEEIYRNPGHVHFGVCEDHKHRDYEQFARILHQVSSLKLIYYH